MWFVLTWLACDEAPAPDTDPCRPGFSLGPDGHCYPPPPRYPDPSPEDALENLPDCVEQPPGDVLDFATGCAGDRCVEDPYSAFVDALGPGDCSSVDTAEEQLECDFGGGLIGAFVVPAGTAEPSPTDEAAYLRLRTDFVGADPGGLAVGVEPRCFVEQLGIPDRLEYERVSGELRVFELRYSITGPDAGLVVRDQERSNGSGPDGVVDNLFLIPR